MDKPLQYQKIDDNYLETIPEIVTSHPVDQVPEIGPVVEPVIVLLGEDTDKTVRQQFISKVYTTLWLQLATTTGIIAICHTHAGVQGYLVSPQGIMCLYGSMAMMFAMTIVMACCPNSVRQQPNDKLFLVIFTLVTSYVLGYVGIFYKTNTLLLGGMTTLGMFSGLSLYAHQTKFDYTTCGNTLCVLLCALLCVGIFLNFFHIPMIQIGYSVGGAVLFSFYIVYDTQLLIGDETRQLRYSVDDYVLATISLYLDIVNLFIYMLEILDGNPSRS